ncbi:hypothetical protein LCGC14_3017960, partial [marine sediment metagenome]
VPTSVACDAKGRIYVSDYMNDRIQVFLPNRKLFKTIKVKRPAQVVVHQRTGEIYVFSWWLNNWELSRREQEMQRRMLRLGPVENPGKGVSYTLPGAGRMGQYVATLDSWAAEPTVWLFRQPYRWRGYRTSWWRAPGIQLLTIKDGKLVVKRSNHYETQRLMSDPKGKEKLGVDPKANASAFVPRNGFRFARGGGRHFDAQPGIHPTNILLPGEVESTESMSRLVGDGIYIGRIWYTYPVNGLRAGDFTGTVVGDSYIIRDGKLAEPLKPNTLRINENIRNVLNGVIGVSKEGKPTLVWAADEIVYAPEMAVEKVRLDSIGEYMETL